MVQRPSQMREDEFMAVFAGVFEHSPWIARQTFAGGLDANHDTPDGLLAAMLAVRDRAPRERLLALIRAHPELAGGARAITQESIHEQRSAGLDACTAEELETIRDLNAGYRERFDFPFIIAVRGRTPPEIIAAMHARLNHDSDTEFATALEQIARIAELRLAAIFSGRAM